MAYDRYDTRNRPRDERSRWSDDRHEGRERGHDDRGFFGRASDEIASWFGDDDAERRRREDRIRDEREGHYNREYSSDRDWDRERMMSHRQRERDWIRERDSGYRPMTGDYGRDRDHADSEQFFAASGIPRGGFGHSDDDRSRFERSQSPWGRDQYRRTSRAGTSDHSDRSRHEDPHYHSWRQRHMSELDRDYDDYRREHQSKFESDFGSWREKRQQKRGLLGQIREHMEVVGSDDEHVGKIDRVAGDRMTLTKSDPDSGGTHHSLSCSDIDRVEGDRVILDCSADQARHRWRDDSRSRALFEREDQGEMGPHMLDRSFPGTYR